LNFFLGRSGGPRRRWRYERATALILQDLLSCRDVWCRFRVAARWGLRRSKSRRLRHRQLRAAAFGSRQRQRCQSWLLPLVVVIYVVATTVNFVVRFSSGASQGSHLTCHRNRFEAPLRERRPLLLPVSDVGLVSAETTAEESHQLLLENTKLLVFGRNHTKLLEQALVRSTFSPRYGPPFSRGHDRSKRGGNGLARRFDAHRLCISGFAGAHRERPPSTLAGRLWQASKLLGSNRKGEGVHCFRGGAACRCPRRGGPASECEHSLPRARQDSRLRFFAHTYLLLGAYAGRGSFFARV